MHTIYDLIIIGAGFGGIRLAQDAVQKGLSVCLISDKAYFEYYPAMYRIVTGAPHSSVVIPLVDISHSNKITFINDTVVDVDLAKKTVFCVSGNNYSGVAVCLALGVTNSYFGIPGMEEHSFGFKSIGKAIHLHSRIHDLFEKNHTASIDEQLVAFHFVIAGGGVSGVELAGELAYHTKDLAKAYGIPFSSVSIDVVESNPTVVPMLPPKAQQAITDRLTKLGVRILCNRRVTESKSWTVHLSDMVIAAKTVIWAAGVAPHPLLATIKNLPISDRKRIVVDGNLCVKGFTDVYAIGDCADTTLSGLAQTAIKQGAYLARYLHAAKKGDILDDFVQHSIAYDVPVGHWWGVFVYKQWVITGLFAWVMRFIIDIHFYFSILPFRRVCKIIIK